MKRHAIGKQVRIYSEQWGAYWRTKSAGYTESVSEAGVYQWEDAWKSTSHCGPEKQIKYEIL